MSTNSPFSQAEDMIRRVSPEGRARAQRERDRRQRAAARLTSRMALAAVIIGIVVTAVDVAVTPIGLVGLIVAVIVFIAACILIHNASKPQRGALSQVKLQELPAHTEQWLEQQRGLLPPASNPLLDSISARLADMAPQLVTLDPREPGAGAVRRLLATDLPALVRGFQDVPASLRTRNGDGGHSADAQLLHGLRVIDSEIGRMTEQLARGAFDELATQNRFLELKYEGESDLG